MPYVGLDNESMHQCSNEGPAGGTLPNLRLALKCALNELFCEREMVQVPETLERLMRCHPWSWFHGSSMQVQHLVKTAWGLSATADPSGLPGEPERLVARMARKLGRLLPPERARLSRAVSVYLDGPEGPQQLRCVMASSGIVLSQTRAFVPEVLVNEGADRLFDEYEVPVERRTAWLQCAAPACGPGFTLLTGNTPHLRGLRLRVKTAREFELLIAYADHALLEGANHVVLAMRTLRDAPDQIRVLFEVGLEAAANQYYEEFIASSQTQPGDAALWGDELRD